VRYRERQQLFEGKLTVISVAQADSAGAGAGVLVVFLIIGVAAYFLPTIVAIMRKVPNVGSVIVLNMLLGWTFVGWVISMAMACRSQPSPAQVSDFHQYPPTGHGPPAHHG